MARKRDVLDLLERFMAETGETQRWVTVNEFRTHFDLDLSAAPAISGFLQRIYQDPFFSCPYRVERIEKITLQKPKHRIIKRYLVARRPQARRKKPEDIGTCVVRETTYDIFTDSAAIEHFDRVLLKKNKGNERTRGR